MFPHELTVQTESVLAELRAIKYKLAVAESCTGGLLAALFTSIPGASDVFERGFVTYSNEAKAEMLGVPMALIAHHGAVSEEVARAMAEGALSHSRAEIALSITGIAGPGGGTAEKPVGLVYIGLAEKSGTVKTERYLFAGTRQDVQLASIQAALGLIIL